MKIPGSCTVVPIIIIMENSWSALPFKTYFVMNNVLNYVTTIRILLLKKFSKNQPQNVFCPIGLVHKRLFFSDHRMAHSTCRNHEQNQEKATAVLQVA